MTEDPVSGGLSPTEAFTQTGCIIADEASGLPRDALAKLLTDQDLIRELAARRVAASRHDGTVRQWEDSVPHAADESPEEARRKEEWGEGPID